MTNDRAIRKAVSLAQQIANASERHRYPRELRQAAMQVLADPSRPTCQVFLLKHEAARAVKHVAVGRALPYPPKKAEFEGPWAGHPGIRIGRQVFHGWIVSLPLADRRPIVITGSVGSGKTVLMVRIAQELSRLQGRVQYNPATACFDPQRNFDGLVHSGYNVLVSFDLRLAWVQDYAPGFVSSVISLTGHLRGLKKSTHLISEACRMIDPVLSSELAPSLPLILQVLHRPGKLKLPGKADYAWSAVTELTAKARSTPIWRPAYSDMPLRMADPGQRTVIRTGPLDITQRRELVGWLVQCWNKTGLASSRDHNLYVLADEGLLLFRRDWSAGNAMESLRNDLLVSRQTGVVPVVNVQLPAEAVPELLGSAGTIICCGMAGEKDSKAVAHAMGLEYGRDVRRLLQSLPIDQALLHTKGRPGPFRVKIPHPGLPDCDAATRRDSAQAFIRRCDVRSGPSWREIYSKIKPSSAAASGSPDSSGPKAQALLKELARTYRNPLRLRQLAGKLGESVVATSRSLKQMENAGQVRRQTIHIGRDRATFAEPTAAGFKKLGLTPPAGGGRGGSAHRGLTGKVEQHLRRQGYRTEREPEIGGKRVDLLAEKGSDRIIVELELTDANCRRNARADLRAAEPGDSILIVAPTKKLKRAIKSAVKAEVSGREFRRIQFTAFREL